MRKHQAEAMVRVRDWGIMTVGSWPTAVPKSTVSKFIPASRSVDKPAKCENWRPAGIGDQWPEIGGKTGWQKLGAVMERSGYP